MPDLTQEEINEYQLEYERSRPVKKVYASQKEIRAYNDLGVSLSDSILR